MDFLISPAYAQAAGGSAGGGLSQILRCGRIAAAVGFRGQGAHVAGVRPRTVGSVVLGRGAGSGLFATFALARAGGSVFWKTHGPATGLPLPTGDRIALALLAITGLLWVAGAGIAVHYTDATARQLAQPGAYIGTVLRYAPVPPHAGSAP